MRSVPNSTRSQYISHYTWISHIIYNDWDTRRCSAPRITSNQGNVIVHYEKREREYSSGASITYIAPHDYVIFMIKVEIVSTEAANKDAIESGLKSRINEAIVMLHSQGNKVLNIHLSSAGKGQRIFVTALIQYEENVGE